MERGDTEEENGDSIELVLQEQCSMNTQKQSRYKEQTRSVTQTSKRKESADDVSCLFANTVIPVDLCVLILPKVNTPKNISSVRSNILQGLSELK